MTNPLGQGSSSWARTTRFAELAWGMPRKKLLSMFSSARSYHRYEGRNPRTGEPVIVRESIGLPSSPPPVPGLIVHVSVAFDDGDGLDSITLTSEYPRPPEASDALVLRTANKVLAALGLDPLDALPDQSKAWKRKATRIVLEYDEECFRLELSPLTSPG